MPSSELPSSLSPFTGVTVVLLLACTVLALAFGYMALAWRRQRHALHSARGGAQVLRQELHSLAARHEVLDAVMRQSALVGFRCNNATSTPLLLVGAGVEQLCGWPAQAIAAQGRRLIDLVDPADRVRTQAQLQQLVVGAAPALLEFRLAHA